MLFYLVHGMFLTTGNSNALRTVWKESRTKVLLNAQGVSAQKLHRDHGIADNSTFHIQIMTVASGFFDEKSWDLCCRVKPGLSLTGRAWLMKLSRDQDVGLSHATLTESPGTGKSASCRLIRLLSVSQFNLPNLLLLPQRPQ